MKGWEGLPASTQGTAWGTSGDYLLQGPAVSRPAPRPRSPGTRGVRAPVRKQLGPRVSGNPTQPQRVGDYSFNTSKPPTSGLPPSMARNAPPYPPTAACVALTKAGPGRGQGPLTAASLQAPSSSPTSSPWPSRASRCSTLSSPSASACAGAASGCGRPSRPTWGVWVRAPHDPRLQLLRGGGGGAASTRAMRVCWVFTCHTSACPVVRNGRCRGPGHAGTQGRNQA